MLGTRMFAGTASGATKFGKVHLGSSGVPSVRTIATSDKLRLPGHGTQQPNIRTTPIESTEVTCLPNVRTTRAQTRLWHHDFTRCQREKRVNVNEVAAEENSPNAKVLLVPRIQPSTRAIQSQKENVISRSRYVAYSSRRGFASYTAVLDFKEIPAPKGLPIIGTTLSLILAGGPKKLHKYIDRRHKELGPIFKDNVGPVTAVFVSEPEEIRKIFSKEGKYPAHIKPEAWLVYNKKHDCTRGLFFMDDEEWLNYRRKMNKLLLKGDLTWIEDCCGASNDLFLEQIARTSGRQFRDMERTLYKWSIDTVLSVLMGADSYRTNHRKIECLANRLAGDVKKVFETTCKLQLIPATMAAKYNISRWRKFEKTVTEALSTANQTLDMIDKYVSEHDGLIARMRAEAIEEDIIRTIVIDLMLGAGDTTSNTMIWALYLLGRNNEVQESLRNDLSVTKLRHTVKETLRLYPAAPFLTRILPETIEVGGYQIPSHTLIVMSIYTSGRNERFFESPEKFIPARWCREYSSAIPISQNASLPFGIGARSCVGRKIAEAQLQGALGRILKEYKVQLLDKDEVGDILEMITKPERSVLLAFIRI